MRKKKLRQITDISSVIDIKTSKENHQVHLSQKLKYTPRPCEDCGRQCKKRRVVYSKVLFNLKNPIWIHQCNCCRQYYNEKTKKFNTSFIGLKKRNGKRFGENGR